MLLVTGNTMAQSVRERTNEMAVLKTLGYSKRVVAGLVLTESFVITAIGGALGLGLAALAADSMAQTLAQYFPVIGVPSSTYIVGAVLIVVLSTNFASSPPGNEPRNNFPNYFVDRQPPSTIFVVVRCVP